MSIDKSKILETAQQYTVRGQIQKAIEEWKKLLTETSNDANIFNTIGDLCLKYQTTEKGKDDAISNYVRAAEIFESSGFALKAIAVYKKILKIVPDNKDIYIRLGNLNCERGLIGNAREDYLAAAKLYTQEGQIREALDVYRKIADLDPANLNVRLKIADIFLKENLKSEAIEEYNKVASVHLESGRRDEAENIYKLILHVDPDNTDAIICIGKFRLEDGYFEEAKAYVKKATERSPDSEEAFSLLVDIYDKTKMYDEAEELIKRRIDDYPDQISYREMLASILLNKEDIKLAADAYLDLCRDYLERNNIEKAFGYAEMTIDIAPDRIAAHELLFDISITLGKKENVDEKGLFLAKYYYESGEIIKAADYYKKILEVNPYSIEAKEGFAKTQPEPDPEPESAHIDLLPVPADISSQLASADAYMKYGLVEKAVLEYQAAISIDPESKIAHSRLKDAYKTTGEQDKAIEECIILIRMYEEEGDGDNLVELIQEAVAINPKDHRIQAYRDKLLAQVHNDISELLEEAGFYAQQGMIDEAAAVYEKILLLNPDNQEAQQRLLEFKGVKSDTVLPEVEVIRGDDDSASSFFDLGEVLKDAVIEDPVRIYAREEEPLIKSFDDLFQEFQDGIRSQLSIEDYETHYNLGIAYKEMGLYQEAIEEFKLCVPGVNRFLDASFMIALCHKDICEYSEAVDILRKAIASPEYDVRNQLAIKYELGELLEIQGKRDDAFVEFNEIYEMDSTYRDVSEKVLSLQKSI